MFDRFTRGERAVGGGTGLGLAIARWVVDLHGGEIAVAEPVAGRRLPHPDHPARGGGVSAEDRQGALPEKTLATPPPAVPTDAAAPSAAAHAGCGRARAVACRARCRDAAGDDAVGYRDGGGAGTHRHVRHRDADGRVSLSAPAAAVRRPLAGPGRADRG